MVAMRQNVKRHECKMQMEILGQEREEGRPETATHEFEKGGLSITQRLIKMGLGLSIYFVFISFFN